jgi:ribonuclease P protein component
VTSSSFALFFAARTPDLNGPRVGFTTPRAVGKAVVRNRLRRRLREAIRLELPRFPAPVDYVFHPRRALLDVDFPRLRREVERIFRKCQQPVAAVVASS